MGSGVVPACYMLEAQLSGWVFPVMTKEGGVSMQGRWPLSQQLTWRPARQQLCLFMAW